MFATAGKVITTITEATPTREEAWEKFQTRFRELLSVAKLMASLGNTVSTGSTK